MAEEQGTNLPFNQIHFPTTRKLDKLHDALVSGHQTTGSTGMGSLRGRRWKR